MRAVVLASFVVAAVVGCSASNTIQFTGSTGEGASTTSTGSPSGSSSSGSGTGASGAGGSSGFGGGIGLGGGLNVDDGGMNDCSAASQLVYVWATNNQIYSFDPPTKAFQPVATPDCPAQSPNSMAIDRNLVAWLNYLSPPGIYTFDLTKKSGCKLAVSPITGFTQVGMGFATDMAGGTAETLYLDGIGGAGLAKVVNNTIVPIGKFSNDTALTGQSCELTGTGDARLFGYFTTFPSVRVAQIDKGTGNILSDDVLNGFSPPSDWAFSFWGGDFYLYAYPVAQNNSPNSSVIHYNPMTKALDFSYVPDVGFTIIGAGVSTCAPVMPPK